MAAPGGTSKNVAEMARTFAEPFGAGDWGYLTRMTLSSGIRKKRF
jgi:hypothetical protein